MIASILKKPTLILNRNWQPVNVASVARALVLVWNEHARFVDPDTYQLFDWNEWSNLEPVGEQFIQAVSRKIRVPEVVTLSEYDRVPSTNVTFSRRNLFKRDRYTCQYCGHQPPADQLTIDHVVPRAHGGGSTWENCVLACMDCNHAKADRTPEQAGMRLRKKPTRPQWNPCYSRHTLRVSSWQKFLSDAYWNSELQE